MSALKPVCVPCRQFFRQVKTGFYFIEGMPSSSPAKPGLAEPDKWKPYKLWSSDKWRCEGCGAEILQGFGSSSLAEHFQPNFKEKCEEFGAEYQVNDC